MRGAVTVYFSVVAFLLLALIGALLEGARYLGQKEDLFRVGKVGLESVLSDYDRDLFDQYGVMFFEEDALLSSRLEEYMRPMLSDEGKAEKKSGLLDFDDVEVIITGKYYSYDGDGAFFARQVSELMKYMETGKIITGLKELVAGMNSGDSMKEAVSRGEAEYEDTDWQEKAKELEEAGSSAETDSGYTAPENINEGVEENIDQSLVGSVRSMICEALLSVAFPGKEFSKRTAEPSLYFDRTWSTGVELDMDITENVLFNEYICSYFGNLLNPAVKEQLAYQQEYILCGFNDDILNTVVVTGKIFAIRTGMNLLSILTHSELNSQTEETAELIAGWTGLVPLVAIVKLMLTSSWAFCESVLDVRSIAEGEKIAFFKNGETMTSTLADAAALTIGGGRAKGSEKGIGYMTYMRLFLFLTGKERVVRTMQMIELNMKRIKEGFSFERLLYGLEGNVYAKRSNLFSQLYSMVGTSRLENEIAVDYGGSY